MSEHEEQQQEETETETETESASSEDSEMAGAVDERAGELTGSKPSPQPEGTAGDPIGDAEQHIAGLDMDEERRKVQQLSKDL
jgi:uncharacterized protein YjbJ (UPF0337 family)